MAYETTNYCNLVLIPVKFPLRTDPLAKLDLSARFFLAKEPLAFRFRSRFLVNQKNLCLFSSQQHGFGFTIKKTLRVNKKTTTYMFCIVLPYSKPTMLQLSGFFVLTPISILNTSKSGFCGFVDLVNFDPVTLFFFFGASILDPWEETPYEGGMFHFVLYVTLVAAAMETDRARSTVWIRWNSLTKKTPRDETGGY